MCEIDAADLVDVFDGPYDGIRPGDAVSEGAPPDAARGAASVRVVRYATQCDGSRAIRSVRSRAIIV